MIFFFRGRRQAAENICYNPAMTDLTGTDVLYRKWDAAHQAVFPKAVFLWTDTRV